MTNNTRRVILLLFCALFASSCKLEKGHKATTSDESQPTQKEAQKKKKVYKVERYDDLTIYDQPRLQFTWAPENYFWAIWSVKLDGSDLRQVIAIKDLNIHGSGLNFRPVRSPNGRYLAVMFDTPTYRAVLFDLKTGKSKVMSPGLGVAHFFWSDDSNEVYYYSSEMVKYNIAKAEAVETPFIYSQGLHALRSKGLVLAVRDKGYDIRKYDGTLVRKVQLTDNRKLGLSSDNAVSEDGRVIVYNMRGKTTIALVDQPETILCKVPRISTRFALDPTGENLYYFGRGLHSMNVRTCQTKKVKFPGEGGVPSHYQIIPARKSK